MGLRALGSDVLSGSDRSTEDSLLSDYSLTYKYQSSEGVSANVRSLARPVELYRLPLDLALLRRYLKGPRVLDFPIGTGRLYPHLIGEYELFGFDIAPLYVDKAKADYPHLADRFQVASFETVNVPMVFDAVYSMRVLNNLKDLTAAVRNVARLLAPGGRWLFTLPAVRCIDPAFGRLLKNNGFEIVVLCKYDAYTAYGSMPWVVNYLYGSLFLRAVRWRVMPQWLYRMVDSLLSCYGTCFVVAEHK